MSVVNFTVKEITSNETTLDKVPFGMSFRWRNKVLVKRTDGNILRDNGLKCMVISDPDKSVPYGLLLNPLTHVVITPVHVSINMIEE